MFPKVVPATLAMIIAAALPGTASAQSFRCKTDLVSVGDNKAAVVSKCGEPVAKDSYCKAVADIAVPGATPQPSTSGPCIRVDEWTYRPGSGQFMTTLKFESGRLRSIVYGDRIP